MGAFGWGVQLGGVSSSVVKYVKYCRDIDQKNNASKVVIDIGVRPFIEPLICKVSILG
jgi:hypothetical protein